jgi:hypothetical protein
MTTPVHGGIVINGANPVQNSQCGVGGAGSSTPGFSGFESGYQQAGNYTTP